MLMRNQWFQMNKGTLILLLLLIPCNVRLLIFLMQNNVIFVISWFILHCIKWYLVPCQIWKLMALKNWHEEKKDYNNSLSYWETFWYPDSLVFCAWLVKRSYGVNKLLGRIALNFVNSNSKTNCTKSCRIWLEYGNVWFDT